jgi:hypothetical protein
MPSVRLPSPVDLVILVGLGSVVVGTRVIDVGRQLIANPVDLGVLVQLVRVGDDHAPVAFFFNPERALLSMLLTSSMISSK